MRHPFLFVGLPICLFATVAFGTSDQPAPSTPPAHADDKKSAAEELSLIEAWGWVITQDCGASNLSLSKDEVAVFLRGLSNGVRGGQSPFDAHDALPYVDQFVDARLDKALKPETDKNISTADKFLSEAKKKTGAIVLANGVVCEIIKPGSGKNPKELDTIRVRYAGHTLDGAEFTNFMGEVVVVPKLLKQGLFEGVQQINAGGSIRLYVPPTLAQSDITNLGVSRGSLMIYDIQLFKIKETTNDDRESALAPPPSELVLPPCPFSDFQLLEEWGWQLSQRTWACNFEYGDHELAALLRGISRGLSGSSPNDDLQPLKLQVMKYVADSRKKAQDRREQKGLIEAKAFFSDLKKKPDVVQLPSGLCYEIVKSGTGPYPQMTSRLWVNYSGHLLDGRVFDSSDPTIGPLAVDLDKVPVGWSEGARKINAGGAIRLYIPPWLGYGTSANGIVRPNSALIFDLELLRFEDIPTEDRVAPPTAAGTMPPDFFPK
jgi:FKBP-type peptidyl-prolyl cis-trans isomerase